MDADKIVKLNAATVRELLTGMQVRSHAKPNAKTNDRRAERWPFAGTVEVWLPEGSYGEQHLLATLHNLSEHGLAMRCRRPIPSDTLINIAIHQPELSCYGEAIVRHCTAAPVGYLIGVEFCDISEGTASGPDK